MQRGDSPEVTSYFGHCSNSLGLGWFLPCSKAAHAPVQFGATSDAAPATQTLGLSKINEQSVIGEAKPYGLSIHWPSEVFITIQLEKPLLLLAYTIALFSKCSYSSVTY